MSAVQASNVQTLMRPPEATPVDRPVHVIKNDEEALAVVEKLAEEFHANAARRDRERILPAKEIDALTLAGVFGITVPKRYGGADVSGSTVAEVFRILSRADSSIGQIPQNHFCWSPVFEQGTPEQAEFFFKRLLAGDRIGNAHSEDTKRRPGDYEHKLERVDGGWVVNGRKYYSTGAIFAQWIPFIAHTGQGAERRSFIYFVDAKQRGVSVVDDWDGMGQRTTASGTTIFENVFIPDFNVFPLTAAPDDGRAYVLNASLIHAAIDVGIAEDVLAAAGDYIRQHNRPWISNPHEEHAKEPFVIRDYGKFGVLVRTAAVSLREAARLIDVARSAPSVEAVLAARLAIADARLVASEAATKVADEFFLLTGARATLSKYGLDRHWRNARIHSLHDPLRWKEYHLGNYYLNGVVPPPGSYI